ncbi:MAG: rhodanese-related sulfurtransferase, partial [Gammaproteobacteria bacterium]|nr:rhodanese-related sulfurtransferase [Gammaproteobacteria bacterium]
GINGTISGTAEGIERVVRYLVDTAGFDDLELKYSTSEQPAFLRMKVKLKREIVTMGIPQVDPKHAVGHYVEPENWNALIADPDTLVIDTRNDYEYEVGTFRGAIDPQTDIFREFPNWMDNYLKSLPEDKHPKNIAMFCTGGIRCEKSTSYLVSQGFDNVYHLKGGILAYLEKVEEDQSLWDGECFVFDRRVTVTHGLKEGQYELCFGCQHPITEDDKQYPDYEEGVSCRHCRRGLTDAQLASFRERQKQLELAKARANKPQKQAD